MFISFEGADGAGKSTQAKLLVDRIKKSGRAVLHVREPGGTPLGEELRRILKSGEAIQARAELFLFEAARAELVERVIQPAIARHDIVIADRFTDSTVAYQAYGRGLPLDEVVAANRTATGGVMPDLTFLLDLSYETASARSDGRDRKSPGPRRFEDAPEDFQRRVIEGYRAIAKSEPQRVIVIDASRSADAVAADIWQHYQQRTALA